MEAAMALFLRDGYRTTTMEHIAAVAGVSKPTVYKFFADKERLFTETILEAIERTGTELVDRAIALAETEQLERDLRRFARLLLSTLMQPALINRRRAVIAEANRLPDFGRTYYELTYTRNLSAIAGSLRTLSDRGLLAIDDPELAAEQFVWLVVEARRNEVMLCGDQVTFTRTELNRYADAAVRVFLRAYAADPAGPPVSRTRSPAPAQAATKRRAR
jgi:TetR/AcrR family transcriptional regulator, mexJK operon transcriptional repressor